MGPEQTTNFSRNRATEAVRSGVLRWAYIILIFDEERGLFVGPVFLPESAAGFEVNWVPTVAGKAWYPYFLLCGPTEAFLDLTWKLPNIQKVQ